MKAGVGAEYDAPESLLADAESVFYELGMNTGRDQFEVSGAKG